MVNAQKFVVPIILLYPFRLKSYPRPTGIIFRCTFHAKYWIKFKSYLISSFLSLLLLLISVAFFTLLERKVLAYIMLRRGPNKPALSGLIIPLADAFKLLSKPFFSPFLGSAFLVRFACLLFFLVPSLL